MKQIKRTICIVLGFIMLFAFAACSGTGTQPVAPSGDVQPSDTPSSPGSPSPSATVKPAPGIPVDELVIPPVTRKQVDTAPEALLEALKDAWVEFSDGELKENAKYLKIKSTKVDEYSEETIIETGAAVEIILYVRISKVYKDGKPTGEVTNGISSIDVNALSNLFTIWPRVNLYAPIRAFICDNPQDAEILTDLIWDNKNTPEQEELLYPIYFGGYRCNLMQPTGKYNAVSNPFRISSTDFFDTVIDGQRLAKPTPQEIDLNTYGYENVLINRAELIGSTITLEMTVTDAYEDFISGTLPDDPKFTRFHSLTADFEGKNLQKDFKKGDKVKVVSTLLYASVNGDASTYYRYDLRLKGQTIEKLP